MKCIICNGESRFYFEVDFYKYANGRYKNLMDNSKYHKCLNCGFTFSKTIYEMDENAWCELNLKTHEIFESQNLDFRIVNQPPYLEQASMINFLAKNNVLGGGILDYAGGIGTLARILKKFYNINIDVYEEYMSEFKSDGEVNYIKKTKLEKYDVVFNSAMFEHITKREHLEHINSLVKDDGVLIIHTLVRENIPKDPFWFYVQPVHCSFHTNNSMQKLMDSWGYTQSIYSPISKCWIMFKSKNKNVVENTLQKLCNESNSFLQRKYLFFKNGFVDYWID